MARKKSTLDTRPEEKKVFISEADQFLFAEGTHYDIYKKLGAHPSVERGKKGYFFGVWAPNAAEIFVIGEFNDWNETANPMKKLGPGGIWSCFIPGVEKNQMYKFLVVTEAGDKLYKADPFANYAEMRPGNASKTTDLSGFKWSDSAWLEKRDQKDMKKEPMAIYECHIGSWMKHPDGTEDGFYNYREFADRACDYMKEMGYTHIELMGIAEYPFDGSWGYQVTGYYAPTSRHGEPADFMYLVNKFHRAGIGVILDWVPAHFATDAHGLGRFDGECIFEHPDPRLGEHPDWGTKIFNYGKTEVKNFLIANALFWLKEYHVDGIRVDAVASMLYLDYGKQDGQWVPNIYGGNKNLEAIEFFKHLNSVIRGTYPGFLTIAEESTAWPMVTGDIKDGGLGFSFKWNMGWMHDFCEYMKLDPYFRKDNHYSMTFAMTYNSSESYILPLSHDEVVHLKCSMLNKMPGYQVDKYANLRNGYTFMMGHNGKKLLFMGQEFGQEREWSEARELDWYLLGENLNKGLQDYVKELLRIYRKYPCLWEDDADWSGFEWMNADDCDRSTYSFIRKCASDKKRLLFIVNMTPMKWEKYRVGVPAKKKYKLLLNSTEERFGGSGAEVPEEITAKKEPCCFKDYSIVLDLPPYSALVYAF
ncbi:1,4-alpha-glucan branching protein GlgB [bacterium 1XD8-76]|nr:1,4-alpha-glucan branching protein GlgB [bacterium 1XD8-76]